MAAAFRHIVTLCTGNICRSPMAEILLADCLAGTGVQVSSAGIGALVGAPADPLALRLMRERGLDLSAHRARQATAALLYSADLVLTAEDLHTQWVLERIPALRGRVFRLARFSGDGDIPDPYRRARPAFEAALKRIDAGIAGWLPRLK